MITIKKWSSFQSYKDRKPPWIRLHKTIIDDFEFQSMSADARAILPMLWLLASEDEDPTSGVIRSDTEKIAFRLRLPESVVLTACAEAESTGFIDFSEVCNETVTPSLRNDNESVTSETETETDKDAHFDRFWDIYPKKKDKKRSLKIWKKLNCDNIVDDICNAVNEQIKHEAISKDIQFIPHPSTWLNGQRWEDETKPKARKGGHEENI